MRILVLCHGRDHKREKYTMCLTSHIKASKVKTSTLLDIDKSCNPDILHDWRKPIKFTKKYDIITTMCCDSSAFYDNKKNAIINQSFKNVADSLDKNGLFIFPKYNWVTPKILSDIQKYLKLEKTVKNKYDTYFYFSLINK